MDIQSLHNKDITFIEKSLDEELILLAEQLIDSNAVSGVNSKNHWDLIVRDQNYHYQVSAKINDQKVKSYQCNCKKSTNNLLCGHIIAALTYIRREQHKVKIAPIRRPNLRKVTELISDLTKPELISIINSYSRKSNEFKLQLLAQLYDTLSDKEQIQLIERSYPIHTENTQKVAPKAASTFLMISENLILHLSNFIVREDYIQAYNLILRLLKKSFYIKSKLTKEHKKLELNHSKLLKQYNVLIENVEAPEFKIMVIKETFDLLSSSYISAESKAEQQLWLKIYSDSANHDNLLMIVYAYIAKGKSSNLGSYYFIKSLGLLIDPDGTQINLDSIDRQESYRIVLNLLGLEKLDGIEKLLKEFLIRNKVNHFIAKQVIDSIEISTEESGLINAILDLYISSGDADFLVKLRASQENTSAIDKLINQYFEEMTDPQHRIQYYLAMERNDDAIQVLKNDSSTALLNKFVKTLKETHQSELIELYLTECCYYLKNHFGPKSREYLAKIYDHLDSNNASSIKEELIKGLKQSIKSNRVN